jgi:hypothetical protein
LKIRNQLPHYSFQPIGQNFRKHFVDASYQANGTVIKSNKSKGWSFLGIRVKKEAVNALGKKAFS